MQSLETKSSRQTPKSFETESRPETFDTETETPKNGSRDTFRDRDQVSRLYHWWVSPSRWWTANWQISQPWVWNYYCLYTSSLPNHINNEIKKRNPEKSASL